VRQVIRRRVIHRQVTLLCALCAAACSSADDKHLPERWAIQYKDKSVGQLIAQLGAPQEFAGAKQYMNWIDPTPGGRRVLKVMCPRNCDDTERPTGILFLVYRDGKSSPVRAESLL
jgi:hypothetical protein